MSNHIGSRRTRRAGGRGWRGRDRAIGSALLVPALGLLCLFTFIPLGNVVMMSLQGTDLFGAPAGFVGISNYRQIFTDPTFLAVMGRTAVYCVSVVLGRLVLGIALAILLTRAVRGIKIFRTLLTSTISVSVSAAALGFQAILSPTGIINAAIRQLGFGPVNWLTDSHWAFPCVTFVTIWTGLGFTLILMCAAIEGVDQEIIEAARIDGAGEARIQWSIVIPLITPTIFYIAVTAGIEALQSFAQINVLTKGGPGGTTTTLVYNIYTEAFGAGSANFGVASALGIVLFVFVFILTMLQFRFLERRVNY